MPTKKIISEDPILSELIAIKRLLVFAIMKAAASQSQIAGALGIDQSQVSRMMGKGGSARGRTK